MAVAKLQLLKSKKRYQFILNFPLFGFKLRVPRKQKKFSDISKYIVALFRRKRVSGRGACVRAVERGVLYRWQ